MGAKKANYDEKCKDDSTEDCKKTKRNQRHLPLLLLVVVMLVVVVMMKSPQRIALHLLCSHTRQLCFSHFSQLQPFKFHLCKYTVVQRLLFKLFCQLKVKAPSVK